MGRRTHPAAVTPEAVARKIRRRKDAERRKRNTLTPGEAAYVAQRIVPGTSHAKAAVQAGLTSVPRKERVRKAIAQHINQQMKAADLTAERVLMEVQRMALIDPALFFNAEGHLLPVPDMPEDARRALSGFKSKRIVSTRKDEDTETTIEDIRYPKDHSLEMLMKHFGALAGSGDESKRDRLKELVAAIQAPYYAEKKEKQ